MSARAGRAAVKKAKAPLPSPPRLGRQFPGEGAGKTTATSLPKRANPHLANLKPDPPSGVPPRALTLLGVGLLGISTYIGYLYASYRLEVERGRSLDLPADISDRYKNSASTYDADVDMQEKLMGLDKLRRDLVQRARGHVLEVCCGTARNAKHYNVNVHHIVDRDGNTEVYGCQSITFVDTISEMVERARVKVDEYLPNFTAKAFFTADINNITGFSTFTAPSLQSVAPSAAQSAIVPGGDPPAYYDTIVSTFGLCSVEDPVQALQHLGSLTEPTKGHILLLEHGLSKWGWLNETINKLAPGHANRHGCWFNRDIGTIVQQSGLQVVSQERHHFGTTWVYVLRPAAQNTAGAAGATGAE